MLKIATWNIGADESHDGNVVNLESYEYIKNMLIDNAIDIICFQENITSSDSIISISKYLEENTDLKFNCDFELSVSDYNKDSMMGVAICSRFSITNYEKIMFENPKIEYEKDENTTYISHDKGFIIAYIDEFPIVITNCFCLPFHIFKKSPLQYLEIFEKAECKVLDILNGHANFIIAGDMNYSVVSELFPKISGLTDITSFENPHKDYSIDHILISYCIKKINSKVIRTRFDHNLCVITIDL